MGRKKIDKKIKKVRIGLSIRKDYIDFFRERDLNISKFCEESMKDYIYKSN